MERRFGCRSPVVLSQYSLKKDVCLSSGTVFRKDKTALVRLCYSSVEKQPTLDSEVGLLQADMAKVVSDLEAERKSFEARSFALESRRFECDTEAKAAEMN